MKHRVTVYNSMAALIFEIDATPLPQTSIIFNTDSLFDIDLPSQLVSFGDGVEVLDPAGSPIQPSILPAWISVGNPNDVSSRASKREPRTATFDRPLVDVAVNEPVIQIITGSEPVVSFSPGSISVILESPRDVKRAPQFADPVNGNIGGSGTTIVFNDETIEFNAPFVQIN